MSRFDQDLFQIKQFLDTNGAEQEAQISLVVIDEAALSTKEHRDRWHHIRPFAGAVTSQECANFFANARFAFQLLEVERNSIVCLCEHVPESNLATVLPGNVLRIDGAGADEDHPDYGSGGSIHGWSRCPGPSLAGL